MGLMAFDQMGLSFNFWAHWARGFWFFSHVWGRQVFRLTWTLYLLDDTVNLRSTSHICN